MKQFDTYGFARADIEAARSAFEKALAVRTTPHESSYLGDYFRFDEGGKETFSLQDNFDELSREARYDQFKEYPVLLFVETERAAEIEKTLVAVGFVLIERVCL